MAELREIFAELADIQARLLDLSADDFAERHKLLSRRDELRRAAAALDDDWEAQRPTEDIEAELAAQRRRLEALVESRSGYVTSKGGNNQGPGGAEIAKLTLRAKGAAGVQPIVARISHLEGLLARRRSAAG